MSVFWQIIMANWTDKSYTVSVFWQIIMANWTDKERVELRDACEAWMALRI